MNKTNLSGWVVFGSLVFFAILAILSLGGNYTEDFKSDFKYCVDYCRIKIGNDISAEQECLNQCINMEKERYVIDKYYCQDLKQVGFNE